MKIYVQSRGKPQDKDYTWLKVKESKLIREIPPILKRIRVGELIQSEKYSIVLARNDGELVLLVTGLSGERSDFMNRQIRNSVAWVEDSPKKERIIRSLAVLALTDKQTLESKVKEAVIEAEATSEYEFEVNREKINQLLSELKPVQDKNNAIKENRVGNNSEQLQTEVGSELEKNLLPSRDGVLVLATTLKTESGLQQYKVWRGLSDKVPYEQLISVSSSSEQDQGKKNWVRIAIVMAVAVVILMILLNLKCLNPTEVIPLLKCLNPTEVIPLLKCLNPTEVIPQNNQKENSPSQVVPQINLPLKK